MRLLFLLAGNLLALLLPLLNSLLQAIRKKLMDIIRCHCYGEKGGSLVVFQKSKIKIKLKA